MRQAESKTAEPETAGLTKKNNNATDLIVAEEPLPGKVGFKDYRNLFSFGPGLCGFFLFIGMSVLVALAQLGTSFSLAYWTAQTLEE